MKRYRGESLTENPRIALVTNDNLGNFVIATPLMQMLRAKHGGSLDYYGGNRVTELAGASDLIDENYPLHGTAPRETACLVAGKDYDLVVNVEWTPWAKAATSILAAHDTFVCGPCIGEDGRQDLPFPDDFTGNLWEDQNWSAPDVTTTHPCLESGYIAEIFCRLAYLDGEVPKYKLPTVVPAQEVPDVWISAAASLPEKLWPLEKWLLLVEELKKAGYSVGLLGAKPSNQAKYWKGSSDEDRLVEAGVQDFRGVFTLPEVVGAISRAKRVVTLDNGILHLSCSTETEVIGLFREGIDRLWAPPNPKLTVLVPKSGAPVSEIGVQNVAEVACRE